MNKLKNITVALALGLSMGACEKVIDIDPISNLGADAFYNNYDDVSIALTGCYNGLQRCLETEFMVTELRSDNALQGFANSSSPLNQEFNELDMFNPHASHDKVYEYWLSTYKNIRAINYVLRSLGVTYRDGQLAMENGKAEVTPAERDQLAGEALFLRAYHYFNLVRLYGSVFLITEPVDPETSKQTTKSGVDEIYKLIKADLLLAKDILSPAAFAEGSNSRTLGRATSWAAKSLLAKVYLTQGSAQEALPLLNDVINNSGHGLLDDYGDVFAVNNEMNREIIFAVRYKAGGLGLGNPMANYFAPLGSGNAVVNGDGTNYNYPSNDIDQAYITPSSGARDLRKEVNIGKYNERLYVNKFISPVTVKFDSENDFPVIRFSDVLMMKAEAQGFDGIAGSSVGILNRIRERAGATEYFGGDFNAQFYLYPTETGAPNAITNEDEWGKALLKERQLELAFENQRFFDLVRTGKAVEVLIQHFTNEYPLHYKNYRPVIELSTILNNVNADKMLLPIPQREIDTNDQMKIPQNEGY